MALRNFFTGLHRTIRALLHRDQWEQGLQDELASHMELRAADLVRRGVPKDAALRQARIELGSQERYRDDTQAAFGLRLLDELRQDAAYAIRTLLRSPGFALTAVLSLALGVGANTVVFSIVNSVLFRPLPVPHADRFLFVHHDPRPTSESMSYPDYRDMRDGAQAIDGAIVYRASRMGVDLSTGSGEGAERHWGFLASGNYFDVLELQPAAGRFFHAEDEKGPDASPYAVLSYDLWQTRFHGDPGVVGRTIRVNALPYTVLGVAPRGFRGTEAFITPDLWVPIAMQAQIEGFKWLETRANHNIWMMIRMKPGVTALQAQADLNRVAAGMVAAYPVEDFGLNIMLAKPGLLGERLRKPVEQFVLGLMLVAGMVLLAACANLAGLQGARSADRFREIAVRVSIGAGRWRILRQLLTESVVLTSVAGLAGCGLAWVLLRMLSDWQPPVEVPIQVNVLPDYRVFLFATAASVLVGILAGIAPARQAWRMNPVEAMKGPQTSKDRRWPVRDLALVLQTALCCVLVVCSLVAGRGLMKTFSMRPGFNPNGVSVVALDPIMASYSPEQAEQFQRRALTAVSQLPGVIGAAYASSIPMTTDQSNTTIFQESAVERRMEEARLVQYFHVSPAYFQTMGTRLLAGREFDWREPNPDAPVAIVNETFARRIVGTTDAVGKHFRNYGGTLVEIIGVVEDGKYFTFTEDPKPVMFRPILGSKRTDTYLLVRSSGSESEMAANMARVVKSLDPAMPVYGVGPVTDVMGLAYLPAWISSIALGAFGILGMMLAVMGIYGLASYSVAKRVREIGIRMAIGARPAQVLQSVLGRVALLVGIGSLAGLVLGLASGGVMSQVVYQASPSDPLTLAGVAVLMLTIALGSTLGPIRRAVTISPIRALRQE